MQGCTTTDHKKNSNQLTTGRWKADVIIQSDKLAIPQLEVFADIIVRHNGDIRMDLLGPFGGRVAAYTQLGTKAHVTLYREQKHLFGEAGPLFFEHLLGVPLESRWIVPILQNSGFKDARWLCNDKEDEQVCTDPITKMTISWESSLTGQQKVQVNYQNSKVDFRIKSYTPDIRKQEKRFLVRVPRSFKKIRVK